MAGKKQYEMSFELSGQIDPQLTRSFDDLSRDVTGLEKDLGQLRRTKGLDKLTREADEAKGAFHDLRENAKEFGEVFEKTLQFTGAHKIITTVGDMFSNMVSEVGALDDSVHQMGAATGATVEEMAEFKDITQEIYKGNFGEGFNDIANALVNVRRVTGEAGDQLEKTTKNALIMRDTFGHDVNESVRSADMLMRQFGLTSEQAYNLVAQGSQKGLDKTGELLDTINEFSPQFATLGFSANEMFDFFATGLDAGAWNLDKVGDLVKEFDNRLKDAGDTANREALANLFGDKKSKKMLDDLSKGALGGAEAFRIILKQLDAIEDPIQRQTLGIAIMGTQYEDLGQKVVGSLTTVNSQFDKTANTMQQIEEVRYSSVTKDIQKLGRELMDSVVIPIGEDLMPVLQNLTAWAIENKDVIKTLALAVPAGMLAKNAVSMGKDFAKVGKSLLGTAGNVGKFGSAVGLLTNPIGLAVGAIGALSLGVLAYKNHQEEARQKLINMGDTLEQAYSDYSAVEGQTKRTQELITEYDRLKDKIDDVNTPSEQLTEARRKMANVEQELIDLNPEILKAEDAKLDSFRNQLDVANELNQTQLQRERRDLESAVLDTEANLPNLMGEYDTMIKKAGEYEKSYLDAKQAYAQFTDYAERARQIYKNTPEASEEREHQLNSLADEILKETGQDYINRMGQLTETKNQYKELYESIRTSMDENQDSFIKSEKTFQQFYDQQVRLIEIQDLGGETIQNQAAGYSKLSEAEKQRTDMAIDKVAELNRTLDEIPLHKQIDLSVVWQQTGAIPDFSTPAGKKLRHIQLRDPGFNGYAEGGYVDSPELAWVGEGRSAEWIIPENNSRRSHALYAAAGEALGYEQGGTWAPVFNMNITVNGKADKEVIVSATRDSYREWEQNLKEYTRYRQRVSLN